MTNKIKIRCLFGKDPDNAEWYLMEALEHEAWAMGLDFKKECKHVTDWRELTVEIDDTRVQELLGGTEVVQGEVVEEEPKPCSHAGSVVSNIIGAMHCEKCHAYLGEVEE